MRAFLGVSVGAAAGIFGFVAGAAWSWTAAAIVAASAAGLAALWLFRWSGLEIDGSACPRGLKIVSAIATVLALAQIARVGVFMIDPARVACSQIPASTWEVEHSCLTAYFIAAEASTRTPAVYDNALYSAPDDDPTQKRKPAKLGTFNVDVFEYPPQFLLLPRALLLLTPAFTDLRMLWFGLNGAVLLLAFFVVASFLGPRDGTRALLLSPLVWLAIPTLNTLQKGNVQALVIAAAMLAMVLLEKRRFAAGGALLAFVTVSKLYPGLLVLYLLVRRQWRAAAWTMGLGAAFSALSLAVFGWPMYTTFVEHLPGLLSGEAFPAFRNPAATAINVSIPGLVFKAKLFGVPGMGFGASKIVGWLYTLVAVAAIAIAAVRTPSDRKQPLVWLAILILATLRSPFLPQGYGLFPAVWLLTLLGATCDSPRRRLPLFVLAFATLNIYWPTDWPMDPRWLAVLNLVPQSLTIALAVLALRARPEVAA